MQRQFKCESRLEFDHILHVERDRRVTSYMTQPPTIGYYWAGKFRRYSPDLLMELHTGELVIREVKPAKRLQAVAEKFLAIRSMFANRGIAFEAMTEIEIQPEPLISTLRALYRHAWYTPSEDIETLVRNLEDDKPISLRQAVSRAEALGISPSAPLSAMFYRAIDWPEDQPLGWEISLAPLSNPKV